MLRSTNRFACAIVMLALMLDGAAVAGEQERQVHTSEGPRLPLSVGSAAGAALGEQVIVVGGERWNDERTVKSILAQTWLYDHEQWHDGPKLPTPMAESAFGSDAKSLCLAGGVSGVNQPTDVACRLNWDQDHVVIQPLHRLPHAIVGSAGEVLKGHFYVCCGYENGKPSNRLYSLDLAYTTADWKELAPLPAPGRAYAALVACGDSLYLLGGLRGDESESNDSVPHRTAADVYRFDPSSNRWTAIGNLPAGGYAWSASAIESSQLLLAGRADGQMHDEIWRIKVSPLSAEVVGHCVIATDCAPLIRVNDTTWWLVGGEPDMNKHRTDRVSVISLRE